MSMGFSCGGGEGGGGRNLRDNCVFRGGGIIVFSGGGVIILCFGGRGSEITVFSGGGLFSIILQYVNLRNFNILRGTPPLLDPRMLRLQPSI